MKELQIGLSKMTSGLFYYGTEEEVAIGDRIRIKRLFGKDLKGVVVYIPGISPKNSDLEYEDVKQWAIELSNGELNVMLYAPNHRLGQPKKNIFLVSRGESEGVKPEDRFH
ncbi:MAG: hypothetical protein KTR15_11935 [Phycisphaeraceae bacterium]|nr:hypothetical protein [Phycisphaeraceae bacterium]